MKDPFPQFTGPVPITKGFDSMYFKTQGLSNQCHIGTDAIWMDTSAPAEEEFFNSGAEADWCFRRVLGGIPLKSLSLCVQSGDGQVSQVALE